MFFVQLHNVQGAHCPYLIKLHFVKPLTSRCCILYIIQQIYVQNILNMLRTLRFFLFKMPFIS